MIAHQYIRFSTEEQAKGGSLKRQRNEIADQIERRGWQTGSEYFDRGKSASKGHNLIEGAQLFRFFEEAERGEHQDTILAIERIDRLSRLEAEDVLPLVRRLLNAGVSLAIGVGDRFLKSGQPLTVIDMITLIIEADHARQEALKLSQRVRAGKAIKREEKRANGISTKNMLPPWLALDDESKAIVIEDRAAIVLSWFEDSAGGIGTGEIQRRMATSGIEPWGKTKVWHRSFISRTLSNRACIGEFQPTQRIDGKPTPLGEPWLGHFPVIVPHDLFHRVQSDAANRKAAMGGRKNGERLGNLFAGLTRCQCCGGSVYYSHDCSAGKMRNDGKGKWWPVKRDLGTLKCRTAKASGGRKCSNKKGWAYLTFEDAMISAILPLVMDDQAFSNSGELARVSALIAERERTLAIARKKAAILWDEFTDTMSKGARDAAVARDQEAAELETNLIALRNQHGEASGRVTAAEHIVRVAEIAGQLHDPDMERRLPVRRKVMIAMRGLIDQIEFSEDQARVMLKGNAGVLFVDRKGNVGGFDLIKNGTEYAASLDDYRRRLASMEQSPFKSGVFQPQGGARKAGVNQASRPFAE